MRHNKRVSRLAANIPLIRRNLCPLSFVDVPDSAYIDGTLAVYALNRTELLQEVFVWACQRSCARYAEIVETELGSLHEGNIARYRLRPAEFSTWKKNWT